jgi:hypothetical protein
MLDGSYEMNTPQTPDWEALAGAPMDTTDGVVIQRIAALYEAIDPVPPQLADEVIFMISLDAMNVELAKLVTVSDQLVRARSGTLQASKVKTLRFSSDSLTAMVTISLSGPDRVRIDGWAAPGGGASIEMRQGAASISTQADADGMFVFEDVPHGTTRFVLRPASPDAHPPVVTPEVEV